MAEAVTAKPVPIRLAYRYPNGCMVSYSARAIARDENSVRVIVNEEFDEGIQLAVMAPFLEGLTTARVASVQRSRKQPGYFEVQLRIGDGTASTSGPRGGGQEQTVGENATGVGQGQQRRDGVATDARPSAVVTDIVVEAAEKLAYELRKLPTRKFSQVLEEIPSEMRSMSLLVAIAAAIHLLQEKGHVDAHRLIGSVAGSAKEAVKS
ncbi:MAG: hypothetical protein HY316_08140 [Acidobacteria bacterium]|nr:hypothetical protein [Acidobacteriota bacterium]